MVDLAVVIVSFNDGPWLERCLPTLVSHTGDIEMDVVLVDNGGDGAAGLVAERFPWVRTITVPNEGFAAANNRGLEAVRARYVLLLNPDTEVREGTLGDLVALLDNRPEVGAAGVIQVKPDGTLCRSIHRFPCASRTFGEALLSERWPIHPASTGERELDPDVYERETDCDWPTGSFLLVRREALLSAGLLDERFFLFSEEPDLCLRIRQAGWRIIHTPVLTIVHHSEKGGVRPAMLAQEAFSRRLYARKHFGRLHRGAYLAALGSRYLLRAAPLQRGEDAGARREAARRALRALRPGAEPPFIPPPATSLPPDAGCGPS